MKPSIPIRVWNTSMRTLTTQIHKMRFFPRVRIRMSLKRSTHPIPTHPNTNPLRGRIIMDLIPIEITKWNPRTIRSNSLHWPRSRTTIQSESGTMTCSRPPITNNPPEDPELRMWKIFHFHPHPILITCEVTPKDIIHPPLSHFTSPILPLPVCLLL